jgi:hypothetical protein
MAPGQTFQPPVMPDSVPLVRYDLLTRKLDTAAFVRSPAPKFNVVQNERGVSMSTTINPLPEVDDWAILPDGTIAILRKDYHVDYVDANGQKTSPKIPFDWQRLTDSAKTAIVDSAKARYGAARAAVRGRLRHHTRWSGRRRRRFGWRSRRWSRRRRPGWSAPSESRADLLRAAVPTETRAVGPPPLTFVDPSEP